LQSLKKHEYEEGKVKKLLYLNTWVCIILVAVSSLTAGIPANEWHYHSAGSGVLIQQDATDTTDNDESSTTKVSERPLIDAIVSSAGLHVDINKSWVSCPLPEYRFAIAAFVVQISVAHFPLPYFRKLFHSSIVAKAP
jgi:hypothetical protein